MMLRNLVANYFGDLWLMLLQFALIPICLHAMGAEAFGMVALHTTLTALAGLTNLGITPALNRETSRLTGLADGPPRIKSFVFSVGAFYLVLSAVTAAVALFLLVGPLVRWVNPVTITTALAQQVVTLMFIQIGLQLLVNFLISVLQGLQLHVRVNAILSAAMTLRLGGAALILLFWQPTLIAFFSWMIFATVIQLFVLSFAAYLALPPGQLRLGFSHLQSIWRYASGMTLTVLFSLLLTQIDRVVLSRFLTLSDFGLYALAANFAAAPTRPASPLARTFLPRLTQLQAQGKPEDVATLYHLGCQIASLVVIPLTAIFAIFPFDVLTTLWIKPPEAEAAAPLLSFLSIGLAGLGLMSLPYCLTWAFGWVRFGLYQNIAGCLVFTPVMIYAAYHHGALGSAMAWAALSVSFVAISPWFIHQKILPTSFRRWYLADVLPPLAISALVGILLKQVLPTGGSWLQDALCLAFAYGTLLGLNLLALNQVRDKIIGIIHTYIRRRSN